MPPCGFTTANTKCPWEEDATSESKAETETTLWKSEIPASQVTEEQPDVQVIKERKAGSFIFDNAPLPKVLEELSRYYKVKLSASNENKRLTASFKNKSLDEIIRFIEKVLNVKIEKVKQ